MINPGKHILVEEQRTTAGNNSVPWSCSGENTCNLFFFTVILKSVYGHRWYTRPRLKLEV